MTTGAQPGAMSGEEMVALTRAHTLFEWSAQSKVDPIPVARARGVHFWTPEGKRFIDLNSQLMSVNIGHGDERVVRAVAKGLTSSYVPLGAVGLRRPIAEHFRDRVFYGGLTYNSHPVACAAALATLAVYEEDRLVERARATGTVMRKLMEELAARHPSVGAVRSIGLFGAFELVRDRRTMEPMAPFNGTSDAMQALARFFREEGLFTFVRWNTFFTNPPLVIGEADLREAFEIIDRGLAITDAAVVGGKGA